LVSFGGDGIYRAPEFTWLPTIGPTALKFLDSAQLGTQYQNDMFVGDVNTGSLYHFKLNQQRDGLALTGALADKVANTQQESQQVVFGKGFGTITDLQVGPDGYLYVLTFGGSLYRIVPLHPISNNSIEKAPSTSSTDNNNIKPSHLHHNKSLTTTSSSSASNNNRKSVPGILEPVN
jgi:hypothetical protein